MILPPSCWPKRPATGPEHNKRTVAEMIATAIWRAGFIFFCAWSAWIQKSLKTIQGTKHINKKELILPR